MNKLVSLITRTKSRPILIPRVFKTVIEQSYRPIEWIIVNDNGESIDTLLEELKLQYAEQLDGIEIVLINKKSSTGMEAASNSGLEYAHGFYIKLLDDDDTLDTICIEKQVYYMENEKLPNERGVICYTHNIFEKIEDDHIHFLSSSPLDLTLENITIADLVQHNQFTVHSFLYEKEVLENIGMYNEALPVLGDWEFNLRFIIKYDIGVIPDFLANYHIRREGVYGNTVVNQRDKHLRYEAAIRNHFVRNKERYGEISVAILNAQSTKQIQLKIDGKTQIINNQLLFEIQLFLDQSNGISEETSIKLPVAQNTEMQEFIFDISDKPNITNLRLDPLNESCVIEIEELKLITDHTEIDLRDHISSNAIIKHGKNYFFDTIDPIINFSSVGQEIFMGAQMLTAIIRYNYIGRDALGVCIKQTKTELNQTNIKLNQTKIELNQIHLSHSWKVTKPLRKIKQILKGN